MNPFKDTFAQLEKKRPSLFLTGLCIAMGLSLSAFEWGKTLSLTEQFIPGEIVEPFEEDTAIVIYTPPPPKPPQPKRSKTAPPVISTEPLALSQEQESETPDLPDEADIDDLFGEETVVEEKITYKPPKQREATPCGCEHIRKLEDRQLCASETLYEALKGSVRYPHMARENGIQGTVYVQFQVSVTGALSNIQVRRGVHPSLDQAALRAVQHAQLCFKPGIQGHIRVPVDFVLPVQFRLKP